MLFIVNLCIKNYHLTFTPVLINQLVYFTCKRIGQRIFGNVA